MILSNVQGRGLLKGVLSKGGGGGGVTDYSQLSGKPQINGVTIENDHDGGYYGLIDSTDIEVTELYEIGYGSNYTINLNGATVHVTDKIFHGATNSNNGEKGLVPAPAAGSVGKILSNEGWIDPPAALPQYSTSEVNTGQKGLDGSYIYFRTFTGTSSTQFTLGLDIKEIYRVDGYILKDSYKFMYPYRDASDYITAAVTPSNDLRVSTSSYFSGGDYQFTVWYTKN